MGLVCLKLPESEIHSRIFTALSLTTKEKGMERFEICKSTHIPWTTLYTHLTELCEKGDISFTHRRIPRKGRPKTMWFRVR